MYDALIVGSGFGGAATALRLAEAGMRVLIVERGDPPRRDEVDWDQRQILIEQCYRSDSPLSVRQYGASRHSALQSNAVLGGNSVFYGGAALRLREADLNGWPISYNDLEPYYCKAEELLGVHGAPGGICEPPRSRPYAFEPVELAPPARRILEAGRKLGLEPFRIPLAINFRDETRPLCIRCTTCDGFPCKIEAKNDVNGTLLRAAQQRGAEIMTGVIADRFVEAAGCISTLECVDSASGKRLQLRAHRFILAAGAIGSSAVLLRSGFDRFSSLLGRGLMRHCNAVVTGFFPFQTNRAGEFHKQICFDDFYEEERSLPGRATGLIQDIYTPAAEIVRHFAPFGLRHIASVTTKYMQNLLCIAEDEARAENRIQLSPHETDRYGLPTTTVDHTYAPEDLRRRDFLVGKARRILKAAGALATRLYQIDTFSHAIGAAPFGSEPDTSVLDADCRFRNVENLWVADGSFMPTSAGVNPSLTITANALRVADRIADRIDP